MAKPQAPGEERRAEQHRPIVEGRPAPSPRAILAATNDPKRAAIGDTRILNSACRRARCMHILYEVHTRLFLRGCVLASDRRASRHGRRHRRPAPRRPVLPSCSPPITVTAPRPRSQPTDAASEQRVSGETLNTRPIERPGEMLEAVPGLIVTQHSGEGKANQYFLRGFNLDHGTDLAHLARRHAGQHAHPRPRPGLRRHQFPDPRAGRQHADPQGAVLGLGGRLLLGRRAAHAPTPTGWRRTSCR